MKVQLLLSVCVLFIYVGPGDAKWTTLVAQLMERLHGLELTKLLGQLQHRSEITKPREELLELYTNCMEKINKWNSKFENHECSFKLAPNWLTFKSDEEIKQLLALKVDINELNGASQGIIRPKRQSEDECPKELFYRDYGFTAPVKYQGSCGGCYAYAAMTALEILYDIYKNKKLSFSQYEVMDCSYAFGNKGCNGGNMGNTYRYMMNASGINQENDYSKMWGTCKKNAAAYRYPISGWAWAPVRDEIALKYLVCQYGVIPVGIDASQYTFHYYKSGVYYEPKCDSNNLNHAVVIVGYGVDEIYGDYWLIQNSWGVEWGDGGYMKIARNKDFHCGIGIYGIYPIVE